MKILLVLIAFCATLCYAADGMSLKYGSDGQIFKHRRELKISLKFCEST